MGSVLGTSSKTLTDMNDVVASPTQPSNPIDGTLWWNTVENKLYVYYTSSGWVFSADGLDIGARNLLLNSSLRKDATSWSGGANGIFVTNVDGYDCFKIVGAMNTTKNISQSVLGKLTVGQVYTISGWWKVENIVKGTTNYTIMFYNDGYYNNSGTSTWFGFGSKNIDVTVSGWQYVSFQFTPDSKMATATSANFYAYTRDFTGNVYIRDLKLEKGNKATDWTPAIEDTTDAINKAQSAIDDMTSDLKVTPLEKQVLSRTWEEIKAEQAQLSAQADSLGVSRTTYDTAYNALDGTSPKIYTEVLTSNLNTTYTFGSTALRDSFKSTITTYYSEAEKLRVAIGGKIQSNAEAYVSSRGENLVTNGTGLLGTNKNFSGFTFDGSDAYSSKGSFKDAGYNTTKTNDELIPVDVSKIYRMSVWAKANPYVGAHYYMGISQYDVDGNAISPDNHMYIANTLTTLKTDLKNGDTVVNLTSLANWNVSTGTNTYQRKFIFWDYKNAGGYQYPENTYSRHLSASDLWADASVNKATNTITLRSAWTGGTIVAGTKLSQGNSGGTYKYCTASNVTVPSTWQFYTGTIGGTDYSGANVTSQFAPGTASIKLLFLNNRDTAGSTVWYSNLSFNIDVASQVDVDDISTTLGNMLNDSVVDVKERQIVKDRLTEILGFPIYNGTTVLPSTSTLDSGTATDNSISVSTKGTFYTARKSATNAGILTTDSTYMDLATKYNALKSYLEGLTPIDAWDVSSANQNTNITVLSKDTWRTNWSNYYLAEQALDTLTAWKLKQNVDGILIGGRNYLLNSGFYKDLNNWFPVNYLIDEENGVNFDDYIDENDSIDVFFNLVLGTDGGDFNANVSAELVSGTPWLRMRGTNSSLYGGLYQNISLDPTKPHILSFIAFAGNNTTSNLKIYFGDTLLSTVNLTTSITKYTIKFQPDTSELLPFKIVGDSPANFEIFATQFNLEQGNLNPTDWTPAPEDAISDGESLKLVVDRVVKAEQKVTDDAIIATVVASTTYTQDLGSKASSSDVSGMAKDVSDLKNTDYDQKTKDAVDKMTQDPDSTLSKTFTTKSELKQTATDITAKFHATGGMNLLRNSIGFSDFIDKATADLGNIQNWFAQGVTSRISRTPSNTDLATLGFGSGFQFMAGTNNTDDASIDQYVTVTPNKKYTMSWYLNKTNTSPTGNDYGAFKVVLLESDDTTPITVNWTVTDADGLHDYSGSEYKYASEYTSSEYETQYVTFTPTTNRVRVRLYACGLATLVVSGLMFTIGDVALQWSLATGETFNTNVRLDINGIRVSQIDGTKTEIGFTQITPDEFAGYHSNDGGKTFEKIFYLNGDETVTKKVRAMEEITMGTIKIINSPNSPAWQASTIYSVDDTVYTLGGNIYRCTVAGVSGSTEPSHTSGTATNGTVTFQYIGNSFGWAFIPIPLG